MVDIASLALVVMEVPPVLFEPCVLVALVGLSSTIAFVAVHLRVEFASVEVDEVPSACETTPASCIVVLAIISCSVVSV